VRGDANAPHPFEPTAGVLPLHQSDLREAVIRGSEKATMERAIDVNRMRTELADFVDEVGPKVR
jgi:hypothetical protein